MARIELSAEVRAIESLIDAGEHGAASNRLQAAHTNLGRRPEYRYLVCLYDSTFHLRPDRDLLSEMIELVGEQPDLMEAAALLAQLYARLGDEARADLFAHLALESANPSARTRAENVLKAYGASQEGPPSSHVKQVERAPVPAIPSRRPSTPAPHGAGPTSFGPTSSGPPTTRSASSAPPARQSSAPPPSVPPSRPSSPPIGEAAPSSSRQLAARYPSAPPPKYHPARAEGGETAPESASEPTALGAWFERARREVVQKRPSYGVRTGQSIVGMLLDWGKTVAEGTSFVSTEAMSLNRDALAQVDEAILSLRRQPGSKTVSRSDTSRAMAAAGFFLAVVLHELDATVLEIAPDDGGCKVVLPSGAGARPLFVAAAFADGTGPSLVHTFDRLAASRELASAATSSEAPFRRPSTSLPAMRQPSLTPVSSTSLGNPRDELALTRPEVEAATIRKLDRPMHPADAPPLNMSAVAGALMRSALSQDIGARSGTSLSPIPASIEALDSFCTATRGELGAAPERTVWPTSDDDEEIILTWGALLGETLIAAYGGIWECDPNAPSDPRLFRVMCEDRVAAWPMAQVYLRLKNGTRHGLAEFVAEVGRLLE